MSNGHTDVKGQPFDFSGEDLRSRHLERPEEPSDFRVPNSATVDLEEPLTNLDTAIFDDGNQFIPQRQSSLVTHQPSPDYHQSSPFRKNLPSVDESQIGKQTLKGTVQEYQSGLRNRNYRSNQAIQTNQVKNPSSAHERLLKHLDNGDLYFGDNVTSDHLSSSLPTPEDLKLGQDPIDLLPADPDPMESGSNSEADPYITNSKTSNQADPVLTSFSERSEFQSAPESPEIDLNKIVVQGDRKSPETDTVVQNNIHALDKGKIGPADFYYNIRTLLEPLLWNSYGRKFGSFEEQLNQKQSPQDQPIPLQKSNLTKATPKRFFNRFPNRRKGANHA